MKPKKKTTQVKKYFWEFLRVLLQRYLVKRFNLEYENESKFRNFKGPFILMPNHVGFWDPFMVAKALKEPVHYVVSNMQFRKLGVKFLLWLVGGIPKRKGVADLETIKIIMAIKRNNGAIGLFPEGSRTWDGVTLPIIRNTAKLIKMLKLPVIVPVIKGGFFTQPRWKMKPGKGKIVISYTQLFEGPDLKKMETEEVADAIQKAVHHDDYSYFKDQQIVFKHKEPAEFIEQALYLCPECKSFLSLRSNKAEIRCISCGQSGIVNEYMNIEGWKFSTIPEWNIWQEEVLKKTIDDFVGSKSAQPIFFTEAYKCTKFHDYRILFNKKSCKLSLYFDRIECRFGNELLVYPLAEVHGQNVQNNEVLEFYHKNDNFYFEDPQHRTSSYLWMNALNYLIDTYITVSEKI